MAQITIRNAHADAPRILQIYAWYVEHTVITLNTPCPRSPSSRAGCGTDAKYPYLVIEKDGASRATLRRCLCGPRRLRLGLRADHLSGPQRPEVRHGPDAVRSTGGPFKGYGHPEPVCLHRLPAGRGRIPDQNSAQFHAHLGFALCGTFRNCGYKFGRWYDMVWMEKIIGEHKADQPAVKAYHYE